MKASPHQRLSGLQASELEVLRERARQLARPLSSEDTTDQVELLEVHSRGQRFALPLSAIEGIVHLTSVAIVPRAPAFVRGLVSFRGEVLVGIELCTFVGGAQPGFADLNRVVAIAAGGTKLALLAEKIVSVRAASTGTFHADPAWQQAYVIGTDESFVTLLDPTALIVHAFKALGPT
jgi:chemotaxis signal transduction protein